MTTKFSSGKNSIAHCDVCGFRYKLKQLKPLVIRTKTTNILACPQCWNPDHPQNLQGMTPVSDPQAVRNPRPDHAATDGSRDFQYGWNPVGLTNPLGLAMTNNLVSISAIGTVTVTTV